MHPIIERDGVKELREGFSREAGSKSPVMRVLQSESLRKMVHVRHGFFYPGDARMRELNFSFKQGEAAQVWAARERACRMIQTDPRHLTHVYQEHGTTIWRISQAERGAGALTGNDPVGVGDGLMTGETDVPLAILVADCLPIYLAHRGGKAVGLAHAGWRGTWSGIAARMVERLADEFGTPADELEAWIGPGISAEAFEVGKDVWEDFQRTWGDCKDCFLEERSFHIDLKRLNTYQLRAAGMREEAIEISPECTVRNRQMFSFRRDGPGAGHNLAVIAIGG